VDDHVGRHGHLKPPTSWAISIAAGARMMMRVLVVMACSSSN
jgi:hypothetical protein